MLLRALGESDDPTVLMGDLNMGRATAERVTGMRPLASGVTFPASRPTVQIDHLLTSPGGLQARAGGPLRLPMSDHCGGPMYFGVCTSISTGAPKAVKLRANCSSLPCLSARDIASAAYMTSPTSTRRSS